MDLLRVAHVSRTAWSPGPPSRAILAWGLVR